MPEFTHFDEGGRAIMVDVGGKQTTARRATASGRIAMSAPCYEAVKTGGAKKGDVLGVARIAGIMALKQTFALIPLCHTVSIDKASVEFSLIDESHAVEAVCAVQCSGVTGVEMEALTGVSVALLTVYDMCKAMDKGMEIQSIRLVEKTGGKSGAYKRVSDA